MRNIFFIITIVFATSSLQAQVGIERENETPIVRGDGIMDFPSPAIKGILLPRVAETTNVPVAGGALAFNVATQMVEIYHPGNNAWVSMTEPGGANVPTQTQNGMFQESASNGTLITAGTVTNSNPPEGVLVLESDDKALILPQVENAALLPSPEAGMICYDMTTKSIAVYNGSVWSFWN
ncbi:hypothetical protein NMK71_11400 [Weeksellaceae bacterium KMM 9713]|uniref:Uncharacterized protein n=1 Tax=Profundicola chukchiensis TaxID=2961959 RepID=A0A9X4N075_9FLAO|nr:hypothetical protein [Profundicola chukchiensis]MDG4947017.1 hypothetical protein [Profundicola chukchiensis]